MLRTDGERDVNGAATDASPGRTIGNSDASAAAAAAAPAAAFLSKTFP